MMRRLHSDDRGAAAVTIAAIMLLLMGMMAIALDGGRGFDERRYAQNAADHASLAAAWASCQATADPIVAGRASATQNGFDNTDPEITVTITDLGSGQWEAVIESDIDATFGSFVGDDEIDTRARAVAYCDHISGLGGHAIFADGSVCGPFELQLDGANLVIDGDVHSNGRLKVTAPAATPGTINGDVTYVESFNKTNVVVTGSETQVPIQPIPGGWIIDDYAPGGSIATVASAAGEYFYSAADVSYSGIIADGLYFSEGDLDLGGISGTGVGGELYATFVARGQIHVTGPANTLTGPWDTTGLSLFSIYNEAQGPKCNVNSIIWSGSSHSWNGVQFAPLGGISMSSASNTTFNGSIIGYTVNLPGADTQISYDNSFPGVPRTYLQLEE